MGVTALSEFYRKTSPQVQERDVEGSLLVFDKLSLDLSLLLHKMKFSSAMDKIKSEDGKEKILEVMKEGWREIYAYFLENGAARSIVLCYEHQDKAGDEEPTKGRNIARGRTLDKVMAEAQDVIDAAGSVAQAATDADGPSNGSRLEMRCAATARDKSAAKLAEAKAALASLLEIKGSKKAKRIRKAEQNVAKSKSALHEASSTVNQLANAMHVEKLVIDLRQATGAFQKDSAMRDIMDFLGGDSVEKAMVALGAEFGFQVFAFRGPRQADVKIRVLCAQLDANKIKNAAVSHDGDIGIEAARVLLARSYNALVHGRSVLVQHEVVSSEMQCSYTDLNHFDSFGDPMDGFRFLAAAGASRVHFRAVARIVGRDGSGIYALGIHNLVMLYKEHLEKLREMDEAVPVFDMLVDYERMENELAAANKDVVKLKKKSAVPGRIDSARRSVERLERAMFDAKRERATLVKEEAAGNADVLGSVAAGILKHVNIAMAQREAPESPYDVDNVEMAMINEAQEAIEIALEPAVEPKAKHKALDKCLNFVQSAASSVGDVDNNFSSVPRAPARDKENYTGVEIPLGSFEAMDSEADGLDSHTHRQIGDSLAALIGTISDITPPAGAVAAASLQALLDGMREDVVESEDGEDISDGICATKCNADTLLHFGDYKCLSENELGGLYKFALRAAERAADEDEDGGAGDGVKLADVLFSGHDHLLNRQAPKALAAQLPDGRLPASISRSRPADMDSPLPSLPSAVVTSHGAALGGNLAAIYENGAIAFRMLTRLMIVATARQLTATDDVHAARLLGHAQNSLSCDHVAGILRAALAPALRAAEMTRLRAELHDLKSSGKNVSSIKSKEKAIEDKIGQLAEKDQALAKERVGHEQRIFRLQADIARLKDEREAAMKLEAAAEAANSGDKMKQAAARARLLRANKGIKQVELELQRERDSLEFLPEPVDNENVLLGAFAERVNGFGSFWLSARSPGRLSRKRPIRAHQLAVVRGLRAVDGGALGALVAALDDAVVVSVGPDAPASTVKYHFTASGGISFVVENQRKRKSSIPGASNMTVVWTGVRTMAVFVRHALRRASLSDFGSPDSPGGRDDVYTGDDENDDDEEEVELEDAEIDEMLAAAADVDEEWGVDDNDDNDDDDEDEDEDEDARADDEPRPAKRRRRDEADGVPVASEEAEAGEPMDTSDSSDGPTPLNRLPFVLPALAPRFRYKERTLTFTPTIWNHVSMKTFLANSTDVSLDKLNALSRQDVLYKMLGAGENRPAWLRAALLSSSKVPKKGKMKGSCMGSLCNLLVVNIGLASAHVAVNEHDMARLLKESANMEKKEAELAGADEDVEPDQAATARSGSRSRIQPMARSAKEPEVPRSPAVSIGGTRPDLQSRELAVDFRANGRYSLTAGRMLDETRTRRRRRLGVLDSGDVYDAHTGELRNGILFSMRHVVAGNFGNLDILTRRQRYECLAVAAIDPDLACFATDIVHRRLAATIEKARAAIMRIVPLKTSNNVMLTDDRVNQFLIGKFAVSTAFSSASSPFDGAMQRRLRKMRHDAPQAERRALLADWLVVSSRPTGHPIFSETAAAELVGEGVWTQDTYEAYLKAGGAPLNLDVGVNSKTPTGFKIRPYRTLRSLAAEAGAYDREHQLAELRAHAHEAIEAAELTKWQRISDPCTMLKEAGKYMTIMRRFRSAWISPKVSHIHFRFRQRRESALASMYQELENDLAAEFGHKAPTVFMFGDATMSGGPARGKKHQHLAWADFRKMATRYGTVLSVNEYLTSSVSACHMAPLAMSYRRTRTRESRRRLRQRARKKKTKSAQRRVMKHGPLPRVVVGHVHGEQRCTRCQHQFHRDANSERLIFLAGYWDVAWQCRPPALCKKSAARRDGGEAPREDDAAHGGRTAAADDGNAPPGQAPQGQEEQE